MKVFFLSFTEAQVEFYANGKFESRIAHPGGCSNCGIRHFGRLIVGESKNLRVDVTPGKGKATVCKDCSIAGLTFFNKRLTPVQVEDVFLSTRAFEV